MNIDLNTVEKKVNNLLNINRGHNQELDDVENVIIFDSYTEEITEILLKKEHDRKINIHNLDNYLELVDKNEKHFLELNNWLYDRHHLLYQKEVLKEIALEQLFQKYTLNDIDELIQKHESNKKIRRS